MARLLIIICFLSITIFSYSQQEQEILAHVIHTYQKELPKLEKRAFRELRKLDKNSNKRKIHEFHKYHFIIIPMFKLKEGYDHYQNDDSFSKYIDFEKMHNDFTAFVFKDTIYQGSMHFSDFDNSFFSLNDTNKFNKPVFNRQLNLASQILKFKPKMVFYPDCPSFLCFIKESKLYIGKGPKQLQTLDYIIPINEVVERTPSFLKELKENRNLGGKHYIRLKNMP